MLPELANLLMVVLKKLVGTIGEGAEQLGELKLIFPRDTLEVCGCSEVKLCRLPCRRVCVQNSFVCG